jgi:hypothetical protein
MSKKRAFSLSRLSVRQREAVWSGLAIGAIVVWAMFLAAPYLDTSTYLWPAGNGLGAKLMGHHFWVRLQQCGSCALWDGAQNGGRPALADIYGSQLHPLVIVTTLLWGVTGGVKIAIVGAMALAGVAQWWIARLLKVSRLPALWTALIAVGGGHLVTLNDEGQFGLMLATASGSLALAALLALALNRRRKDTIVLALMGGLMLVSGQGYMQFALLLWVPAVLFLWRRWDNGRSFFREALLAVVLAVLLAGVLIVPTAHFWPNFVKDTADPSFGFASPLEYIPLNLVIHDMAFYVYGEVLGKQPHMELQFVGWVPVLLAVLSLRFARRDNYRPLAFFTCGAALTIFFGSAIPLRALGPWVPFLYNIRYPTVIMGLVVPAVLALAAFGFDEFLKLRFPRVELSLTGLASRPVLALPLKWLLIIPLVIALQQIYSFSTNFIYLRDLTPAYLGMSAFATPGAQWISPPPGEVDFTEPAIYSGLKVTSLFYPAVLAGREAPPPYLLADRGAVPPDSVPAGSFLDIPVYQLAQAEYAFVQLPDGTLHPCQARAQGGRIAVACDAPQAGQLIVRENAFSGWQVRRDGEAGRLALLGGPWLSVPAAAGAHNYQFVYRPWDVPLGLLLTLVGLTACVLLWRQRPPAATPEPIKEAVTAPAIEPMGAAA